LRETVLEARGLSVSFDVGGRALKAVDGVDFSLRRGEVLAVVGESGSGKSAMAMSLIGLNRGPGTTIAGEVSFGGRNLVDAPESALRRIRGEEIAMVFQDALAALNPLQKVGAQVGEMIREHHDVSRTDAWARSEALLADVGISRPGEASHRYPHEFSGGMRQRVMTAMALANDPKVLIADEPTTALDVTIQAQVLALLRRLKDEHDAAIVFITHDLGVVSEIADRVIVMYAGRIVEQGTRDQVLYEPQHPYTWGLLGSMPRVDGPLLERLQAIPGTPLTGVDRPAGCAFAPRCRHAHDGCAVRPELRRRAGGPGHLDACVLPDHAKMERA
jgi:oligopeptide/dipeptide ABC transporter ATP-binding protein